MHEARRRRLCHQARGSGASFARRFWRSLRRVKPAADVLLVSDDATALVPVQLALHFYVHVSAMSVAKAMASTVPALVVVLYVPDKSQGARALRAVSAFPGLSRGVGQQ